MISNQVSKPYPAWYISHHRCSHGMLANVCVMTQCEHYDGLNMDTCQSKYVSGGYRKRGLKERERDLFGEVSDD